MVVWLILGASVLFIGMLSLVLMCWFVVWPIPPHVIYKNSPWIEPQLRAMAISQSANNGFYYSNERRDLTILMRQRPQESQQAITRCLRSSNPQIKLAALQFTFLAHEYEYITPAIQTEIKRAMSDKDAKIRREAIRSAQYLPPTAGVVLLQAFAADLLHGTEERYLAIQIFRHWKSKESLQAVLPFLNDSDASIRRVTLVTLTNIGDPEVIPEVTRCLQDVDRNVILQAKIFLERVPPVTTP
jgi:hypothetical protein